MGTPDTRISTIEEKYILYPSPVLNISSISRMINDLESKWNAVLLERSVREIKLTPDGTKLFTYAINLVTEYEKFMIEVDELFNIIYFFLVLPEKKFRDII